MIIYVLDLLYDRFEIVFKRDGNWKHIRIPIGEVLTPVASRLVGVILSARRQISIRLVVADPDCHQDDFMKVPRAIFPVQRSCTHTKPIPLEVEPITKEVVPITLKMEPITMETEPIRKMKNQQDLKLTFRVIPRPIGLEAHSIDLETRPIGMGTRPMGINQEPIRKIEVAKAPEPIQ